jgi:membrane peptidoglycan carboxypeptidase
MRMMMRRVMTEPHGTGHLLHVIGYTVGGKTGTAQIFDYAHHVYTHRYNASFMGFAPLNDPSLVVVVTINGTSGEAGYGGTAAGPVFVKLMSSGLNRLGVAYDDPEEIEELIAKGKDKAKSKDDVPEKDADTVADVSTPFSPEEELEAEGVATPAEATAADADPNAPKVPNFVGKTVRDVMQEAAAGGVDLDMLGDGLARAQTPAPGALLLPGVRVRVRFAR